MRAHLDAAAGKYGAPSNADGRVAIEWSMEPVETGWDNFVIGWTETGGPTVQALRICRQTRKSGVFSNGKARCRQKIDGRRRPHKERLTASPGLAFAVFSTTAMSGACFQAFNRAGARIGVGLQTSEIHAVAEASPPAAHPWPRWYGIVPANLSYPDVTLYEAVAAAAGATPKAIAWDFMDTTQTYVVLKDGQPATPAMEEEPIGYCQSQLIKWSCPRGVEFRCELPGTRVGKVDYRALMDGEAGMNDDVKPAGHGGARIAAALEAHGVRLLFTLCGGHISPILAGAKALGIRVVDTRGEAAAVFAADAVARLTGIPGVAAVTAGPGVTNAITPLKNAQMAQSPVVLLGGAAPALLQGRGALQDIDQRPIAAPNVKFLKRVRRVRDLIPAVEDAFAAARSGVQGPAFVECPVDLLYEETLVRQWYGDAAGKGTGVAGRLLRLYVKRHLASMFGKSTPARPPRARKIGTPAASLASVAAASEALSHAERPIAVIGSQALSGANDPAGTAGAIARLGIPVYLSGMARGLLGPQHPLQLRHKRREALKEADCVILAGAPSDFRLDYGNHVRRSATLIAANRSRKEARLNRVPDIAAIGDSGLFLQQLAGEAHGSPARWRDWTQGLQARDAAREAEIAEQAKAEGEFVNPIALLKAVDAAAADDAVFVADGGDFVGTASYILRPRGPLGWLDPGPFGTLGVGGGFALGAALCRPGAEVWAIFGDGALGYSIAEFDTFVRHGVPIIAVVGNDAGWTQIAREQVKVLKDDVATTLARTAYHEVAAGFGAEGILVKSNAEVPEALQRAKAAAKAGRPVLINAWLDRTAFREGSLSM